MQFRQLILTSIPRLFYVDPKDMVLKGEVKWMNDMDQRLEKINETCFKINLDTRYYKFTDIVNGSQYWIDLISTAHANSTLS